MRRAFLAAVVVSLLLAVGETAQAAGPKVVINVTLTSGAKVQVSAAGALLKGAGQLTYGTKVHYPMKVNSGSITGTYVTLLGVIRGSKGGYPFKLVGNAASGNAWLTVGGGSGLSGHGSVLIIK